MLGTVVGMMPTREMFDCLGLLIVGEVDCVGVDYVRGWFTGRGLIHAVCSDSNLACTVSII